MYKQIKLFLVVSVIIFTGGCASKSTIIFTAKETKFPISLTEGFYNEKYDLILREKYEVIHHFKLTYNKVSLTRFSSPKYINLSDKLSKILSNYDGDAIVNLTVTGSGYEPYDWLLGFLTLGFIVPSEVQVGVEGDVVKLLENKHSFSDDSGTLFIVVLKNSREPYPLSKN